MSAARLIIAYEKTARELGATQIIISNSTNVNTDRTAGLYARVGFEHVGYVFSKFV